MKKQARDIAKTSNGKVVLVAADELKVTSSFYGSIFAEKEKINGKTEYSKIPISLLEVGGSKKNVTFYLDVDQAEYLYEFAKSFGDCSSKPRLFAVRYTIMPVIMKASITIITDGIRIRILNDNFIFLPLLRCKFILIINPV